MYLLASIWVFIGGSLGVSIGVSMGVSIEQWRGRRRLGLGQLLRIQRGSFSDIQEINIFVLFEVSKMAVPHIW